MTAGSVAVVTREQERGLREARALRLHKVRSAAARNRLGAQSWRSRVASSVARGGNSLHAATALCLGVSTRILGKIMQYVVRNK